MQSYTSDSFLYRVGGVRERYFGSDLETNVEIWHHLVFKRGKVKTILKGKCGNLGMSANQVCKSSVRLLLLQRDSGRVTRFKIDQ
ncbi:hypothetical protein EXN66_Car014930 [Channa argus]|uniref:Uncharacterized protein n=1 Tax=Channa argus TaxID=215402 RepID=A0A6G1QA86_CHAAH|nr:hypothetical protein EXN66_Car014930 [Channa argus]